MEQIGIRLKVWLRDHNNVNVGGFKSWRFGAEAPVNDLVEKIDKVLHVDTDYQVLYVIRYETSTGAAELEQFCKTGTLQEANVKDGDVIVVKHSDLDNWKFYLNNIERLKDLSEHEAKSVLKTPEFEAYRRKMKQIAEEATNRLGELHRSKFFLAYALFTIQRDAMVDRTGFWLTHAERKWLEKAVTTYFEKRFLGAKVTCNRPAGKTIGQQLAFLVDVKDDANNQTLASYYAKTMGGIESSQLPASKGPVDLREIFVYHLLSLIGVGSEEVCVIPDGPRSGYVYLATKIIDGFWTGEGNKAKSNDMMRGVLGAEGEGKPIIDQGSKKAKDEQLILLTWLLGLGYLRFNQKNWGYAKNLEGQIPAYKFWIVDFSFEDQARPNEITSTMKEYVTQWNIRKRIAETRDRMLHDDATRNKVGEDEEAYEKEKADKKEKAAANNLKKYIEKIQRNLSSFEKALEKSGSLKRKADDSQEEEEGKKED